MPVDRRRASATSTKITLAHRLVERGVYHPTTSFLGTLSDRKVK